MKSLSPHKILLLILIVLAIVFIGFEFNKLADLYIYLTAASNLFSPENLYNQLYGDPPLFFYMGNPFITLWFYPLSLLPFQLVALCWKILSILALYRIYKIIHAYLGNELSSNQKKRLWIFAIFGTSIFTIYANLHLVQLTILMLYAALEGIYQITKKDNAIGGGLLMSFAIAIKISPIVFLPYLIYRKYYKAAVLILFCCCLFLFAPALFLGWEVNLNLWAEWWGIIDPQTSIFDMNNRKNHGISALLSTLFLENIKDNVENLTHRRHLIHLGESTVIYLIYFCRLLLVVLTLYFLRTRPFQKIRNQFHQFWELSYLFLVIPLLFPQQRTYNFLFLMPALAYLAYNFIQNKQLIAHYKVKLSVFIFSSLLLNLELILGQFRKYYWHHKTITYATLLILILLLIIKPQKITNSKTEEIST